MNNTLNLKVLEDCRRIEGDNVGGRKDGKAIRFAFSEFDLSDIENPTLKQVN